MWRNRINQINRIRREPPKNQKLKTAQLITAIAANLVTALAGTGAFLVFLWSINLGLIQERDQIFSGHWSTAAEGHIDCPLPEQKNIKLSISSDGRKLGGEIYIDNPFEGNLDRGDEDFLRKWSKMYTNYFLIEGKLNIVGSANKGFIKFYDYRRGKKVFFGKAKIKIVNNQLYLKTLKRAYETIPMHAAFCTEIEDIEAN